MRRANDFYPTPRWATNELLRHVLPGLDLFECCAGGGAIANVLEGINGKSYVTRNDINREMPNLNFAFDASDESQWIGHYDWVITNPPFNQAAKIVPIAYSRAKRGIAMLLRLSFLEPVEDRGAWLNEYPPTTLIVLPRISFTGNGKTDSVTCAWMVWEKNKTDQRIIVAGNPRFVKHETSQSTFANFSAGIQTADIGPLP